MRGGSVLTRYLNIQFEGIFKAVLRKIDLFLYFFIFLLWGECFEIKISQGRRALIAFTKFMKCDQSFMHHWFPSDSDHCSNASLLASVLNNVVFLKI